MSKKIFAAALLATFGLGAKVAHADIGQQTAQRLQTRPAQRAPVNACKPLRAC